MWNDLAENDVIYPSDCAEYVLKGSEIAGKFLKKIGNHTISFEIWGFAKKNRVFFCFVFVDKYQEVHVNRPLSGPIQEAPKSRLLRSKPKPQNRTTSFDNSELYVGEEEEVVEDEEGEYELSEEKTSYTSSTTPQSRCSRGVSTETIEFVEKKPNLIKKTEQDLPLRSDSSELTRSDPVEPRRVDVSKRVEDGDPVDPGSSRGSIWLQMISCGHIAKYYAPSVMMNPRQKEENLRKGVLCKNIVKKTVVEDEREMIRFMSENPRFGNPQAEEKEYFSGSIVESVSQERVTAEPALRRSNSFNEERLVHRVISVNQLELTIIWLQRLLLKSRLNFKIFEQTNDCRNVYGDEEEERRKRREIDREGEMYTEKEELVMFNVIIEANQEIIKKKISIKCDE